MIRYLGRCIIRFSPLIASVLIVIEIIITNQLVGGGQEVRSVDVSIDELKQENAIIEQKVASASSLLTVSAKAIESGFIFPVKSQFFTIAPSELTVALAHE